MSGAREGEIKEGDFVLVNVRVADAETGKVYMTTIEEEAREAGIYSPDDLYEPMLIVVGEGRIFKRAEESMVGRRVGEEIEVELEPKDAFGEYDPDREKIFPISRLRKAGIKDVAVGDIIRYGDERGIVRSISGGRVRIDFNHPLAGRRIRVWLRPEAILTDPAEMVRALVARYFDVPLDRVSARVDGEVAEVELPPAAYTRRDAFVRKIRVMSAVMRWLKDLKRVRFVEEFEVPEEEAEVSEREEAAGEVEAEASSEAASKEA